MIQIELYVRNVEEPADIFTRIFGFKEIENRLGWRNVQYKDAYQIMLFDPLTNKEHETDWIFPEPDKTGIGVQIVIGVEDAAEKRDQLKDLGYRCSPLHKAPWGTLEFIFNLKDGYLIRVKQSL